ncbi:MAG: hypothetical protein ABSH51_06165 [Solirubrobacteraceae bacterium]|jgi:hypothetical protein
MEIAHTAAALELLPHAAEPAVTPGADHPASVLLTGSRRPARARLERLWRRTAAVRGEAGAYHEKARGSEEPMTLELILLREQVARLKTECHRPADLGAVIDHMRHLTVALAEVENEDDAWSALTDVLVMRDGLNRASAEAEAAIGAARQRLSARGPASAVAAPADSATGTDGSWLPTATDLRDSRGAAA